MESVLFLLFLSLFMLLLVTEITICLLRGDTKKIPYCLGSILSSFLVMCCWWKTLTKYCIVILILLFCIYTVFIAVFKIILSRIIHAERFSFDGKVLSNMFLFDLPLLFVSPDYFVTKLCKDVLYQAKYDKRAKQIWGFNLENIFLSSVFVMLLTSIVTIYPEYECTLIKGLLGLLIFRVISRTIEIAVSFIVDVCKQEHSSTLKSNERIKLAFLSLLEVVILTFGVGYCYGRSNGESISEAAYEALTIINSLPSKFSNPADIAKIFCGLACFSLVGIVIGTYIGNKNTNIKTALEDLPLLFVTRDNDVKNTLTLSETDEKFIYKIAIRNLEGCSYFVKDGDKHIDCEDYSRFDYVYPTPNNKDFMLDGEEFAITYDSFNKRIVNIERKDKVQDEK